jgi:hypothetical protein
MSWSSASQSPRWLTWLERRIGWIELPNIALIFCTLQALGFLMVAYRPDFYGKLFLDPGAVLAGEYWRLLTFLALPISMSPLWVIFVLWFLYFILNTIESEWGAFKTTFYVLVSIFLTVTYSMLTGYPVTSISHFESTLFLAAAAMYPEMEIRLFLVFPVKMKWLAWLTAGFVVYELVVGNWFDRFHLLAIYSNFVLFFGPGVLNRVHQWRRKAEFRRKMSE